MSNTILLLVGLMIAYPINMPQVAKEPALFLMAVCVTIDIFRAMSWLFYDKST
jgi:hypothetical protein